MRFGQFHGRGAIGRMDDRNIHPGIPDCCDDLVKFSDLLPHPGLVAGVGRGKMGEQTLHPNARQRSGGLQKRDDLGWQQAVPAHTGIHFDVYRHRFPLGSG